jgi:hypothetical protein
VATRPPLELVDGGIPGDGRGIAKRSQVPKWYKDLAWNYDKAGEPRDLKASKAAGSLNAAMILSNDQRWKTQAGAPKLQWDSFSLRMTVEDPPWKTPRATLGPLRPGITDWEDTDDTRLQHWLFIEYDLNVSDAQVTAALKQVSRAQEHHPVREYLAGLTWDGTPRIERWLIEYFGCDDTPYARSVGRRWLTSAIARVMNPGCQADYMLVLEGSTGIGKSTALAALCPSREWFGDSKLDLGSKDRFTSLRGNWIREWGEMGELKSARDIDTAKSWIFRRRGSACSLAPRRTRSISATWPRAAGGPCAAASRRRRQSPPFAISSGQRRVGTTSSGPRRTPWSSNGGRPSRSAPHSPSSKRTA